MNAGRSGKGIHSLHVGFVNGVGSVNGLVLLSTRSEFVDALKGRRPPPPPKNPFSLRLGLVAPRFQKGEERADQRR